MEPITHPKGSDHPEWNESYYFTFFNKEHNIGAMSRIGYKPNKPEGMTFLIFFLADGSVAIYHKIEKIKDYSNPLKVGEMEHNCLSDGKWNYTFKGKGIFLKNPKDLLKLQGKSKLRLLFKLISKKLVRISFSINLNFDAINDVYEYSEYMTPESLEIGKKAGDLHWEQIAKINGEIKIKNDIFNISNTLGQRDHTFGIRDWTGVGNWLYYVIWFNENLAINPAAIITNDNKISSGGFLFKNGKNIPLKDIKVIEQIFDENNIYPISSKLELIDFNDNIHILNAEAGKIVPVPFEDKDGNKAILIQSFGRFELDGIPNGYGTFETLRKLK